MNNTSFDEEKVEVAVTRARVSPSNTVWRLKKANVGG